MTFQSVQGSNWPRMYQNQIKSEANNGFWKVPTQFLEKIKYFNASNIGICSKPYRLFLVLSGGVAGFSKLKWTLEKKKESCTLRDHRLILHSNQQLAAQTTNRTYFASLCLLLS